MSIEITGVRQLGESIVEATVGQWLKNEGDPVDGGRAAGRAGDRQGQHGGQRARRGRAPAASSSTRARRSASARCWRTSSDGAGAGAPAARHPPPRSRRPRPRPPPATARQPWLRSRRRGGAEAADDCRRLPRDATGAPHRRRAGIDLQRDQRHRAAAARSPRTTSRRISPDMRRPPQHRRSRRHAAPRPAPLTPPAPHQQPAASRQPPCR